jgi:predicted Zn-dependent peptidase
VRTGARDETAEVAGVSHFLEHMVFKGTPRRSAADVNRELDELGSHSNAYTSEEQTVYYATVLPEYQLPLLDLLADIMRPSLRQEDFETEQQVIIEEILKYDDQPPYGAHERCMAAYFGSHPLGQSVLGTVATVGALTPQAMRAYFQQRYSPGNMVLVATGRVDFQQLVAAAQQRCGDWEPFDTRRDVRAAVGHGTSQRLTKEVATQAYAVQISSGPSATDLRRYASRTLATILGDDSGSRYYWSLVDSGLAEYAAMGAYEFDGAGVLMSYLCCAPAEADRNLQRIREIQEEVERHGVTADELELAKSKICSHVVRQGERPSNRLFSVGNSWLQRREYRSVRQAVDAYQSVALDDIEAVLARHPLTANATVSIGPAGS